MPTSCGDANNSSGAISPAAQIAGVIDTTSNYVEHPEVVADRLTAITNVIGDPRRIVAGTDCGFRHLGRHRRRCSVCGPGRNYVSLTAGAAIASTRLF